MSTEPILLNLTRYKLAPHLIGVVDYLQDERKERDAFWYDQFLTHHAGYAPSTRAADERIVEFLLLANSSKAPRPGQYTGIIFEADSDLLHEMINEMTRYAKDPGIPWLYDVYIPVLNNSGLIETYRLVQRSEYKPKHEQEQDYEEE